ncbi:Type I transmembrane sorting receptor [Tulasnella sp. 424]|nr:Type I transmembrane sorting receptor [Tulasnella sp. 424]
MILPTSAITTVLLLAPLVATNPTQPQRQAHVIPIRQQRRSFNTSPDTPFNAVAARAERNKVSNRYANLASKKRSLGPEGRMEVKAEAIEPFDIQSLKKRQGSGTISLNDNGDVAYAGALTVGTPAQQLTADFDTGSADLLIPTFTNQYGDGSQESGTVASDNVAVGGLTVEYQAFAAITQESGDYGANGTFTVLMGMAFPADSKANATPFVFNLVSLHSLTSNLFSFYLARGNNTGSELCIGCTDSSKYTGDVAYYPLEASATNGTQTHWSIAADGITVNGQNATQGLSCIMDTGTTAIWVPLAHAQALYASIPGATPAPGQPNGYYAFPCNQTIPEVAFVLGGKPFAIDARDFNAGPVTEGSDLCMGAIFGSAQAVNFAIVGDVFLKNWYSIYDAGGKRVGLAKSNQ